MDEFDVPWERFFECAPAMFYPNAVFDAEGVTTKPDKWTNTCAIRVINILKEFL